MVLRFLYGIIIGIGSLLPTIAICQSAPRLIFADQTVRVINVDKDVIVTMVRLQWQDEDWLEAFPIYTWHAHKNHIRQAIAGRYTIEETVVYFTPLFPFVEGETYFAELDFKKIKEKASGHSVGKKLPQGRENIELIFTIPSSVVPQTFVEAVHPARDTLPANLLRMYIYFSAPMSMGEAYEHLHLKDENGKEVDKPFLVVDQELWDGNRQRFTLLFDPGRIKRGVKSNIDLGMALRAGHSYRLVIDSAWQDGRGNALMRGVDKKLVITAPAREKLSKENWKIIDPEAGSKNPLVVKFDKALDHALGLKYIVVTDSFGNIVEGKAEMREKDTVWTFSPVKTWTAGQYFLKISPFLEDPAGNNFNNAFDVDVSVDKRVNSDEPVIISFRVGQEMN